ncbi:cation:proton antiporter domain-containing protein [Roseivirga echinicomitans]|uniref:cation:proton antiporter domain-containing protein n=1 Tax=Roseivirga echinicomitans TaxID=296218 RepID=UPI000A021570|nr:cation:proton antiporter [Roseivirga echinicomitans]
MNVYNLIIALSCVIIFSHLFNILSKRTNIPSVILLIILGIGIKFGLDAYGINQDKLIFSTLELLGIVGLIMIVLEAALDLELSKEKWPIIWKSFTVALISLGGCAFLIALIINQFYHEDPLISLVYAIPLSIVSSAIVIPSVTSLMKDKKEFMIYESTFSDILGIMFFYFLTGNAETEQAGEVVYGIIGNIIITIVISFVFSYGLVLLFQRIEGEVKLFLLIAMLILIYAIGKQMHLSSLVIILTFGLVINNSKLFFVGKLQKWIKHDVIDKILDELHLVTRETAFVVRTFFFVVFGTTINLSALVNLEVLGISLMIVASFFLIRFIVLKAFFWKKSILPELMITPRGLITVLLFFSIPVELQSELFNGDIILITILSTSIIMTWGLISFSKNTDTLPEGIKGARKISYFIERMEPDLRTAEPIRTQANASIVPKKVEPKVEPKDEIKPETKDPSLDNSEEFEGE